MIPSVNYVAVVAGAVANMVIGFGWYSMSGFGKPWMKMLGFTKESIEKAKKEMGPKYGIMVVAALVMAAVLAVLEKSLGVSTVAGGIKTGLLVWIGFVATIGINSFVFENKPIQLYAINVGYYLAALLAQGVILAVM